MPQAAYPQRDPRAPSAPLGGMGPMAPFGGYSEAIPNGKPFRLDGDSEWKAISDSPNDPFNNTLRTFWLQTTLLTTPYRHKCLKCILAPILSHFWPRPSKSRNWNRKQQFWTPFLLGGRKGKTSSRGHFWHQPKSGRILGANSRKLKLRRI